MKLNPSGERWCPLGVVFSPALDALFVADRNNNRILVLNPRVGSFRQVLHLPWDMGFIGEIRLLQDRMVVGHAMTNKTRSTVQVSVFPLQEKADNEEET